MFSIWTVKYGRIFVVTEKFATHCCCFGVLFLRLLFIQSWSPKETNTKNKFQTTKWDFQIMHYFLVEERKPFLEHFFSLLHWPFIFSSIFAGSSITRSYY